MRVLPKRGDLTHSYMLDYQRVTGRTRGPIHFELSLSNPESGMGQQVRTQVPRFYEVYILDRKVQYRI